MKKINYLFAALLLTIAAAPSMAANFDLGELAVPSYTTFGNAFSHTGTYTDTVNFSISQSAAAAGLVTAFDLSILRNINLVSAVLSGSTLASNVVISGLTQGLLAAGNYTLTIVSSVTGSNLIALPNTGYTGSIALVRAANSSVPEPATLALLGAGLVGVALRARRRRGLAA